MGTEFTSNGERMGNRWSGGRDRGTQVQVEFTEAQWDSMDMNQSVQGDDGSEWATRTEWMAEMQATTTVTWMNRFTMNRRAREFEDVARRWGASGHDSVAFSAAAMAQEARKWTD